MCNGCNKIIFEYAKPPEGAVKMDAKEYQEQAARTLITNPGEFTNSEIMSIWCAMGLAGEAGETVELIKKGIFHRHGLDKEKLTKELGDVLWYISGLCTVQGIDLERVMIANIEKLRLRYPDGFTTADSVARVDTSPLPVKEIGKDVDYL
jgi:NTP pyrophosphatase (non-canonical NTP hydrolase)